MTEITPLFWGDFNHLTHHTNQGGLNKKESQLNLSNIFSIYVFNKLYLFA